MLVTVIGRGHSGTRAISKTLSLSGVYMGEPLNVSSDLVPPEKMYDACRVMAQYVKYLGDNRWDFSALHTCEIPNEFKTLIEEYLHSVLSNNSENKGWKIPETTLVYPWIIRMFPEIRVIHWVRDPRDCIIGDHMTDDLNDFGIEYEKSDSERKNRAISWYYQREIVRNTPAHKYETFVRFEDMVFDQDKTLRQIGDFLGIELAKIEMRTDSVGRYKKDTGENMFEIFRQDMIDLGYEL